MIQGFSSGFLNRKLMYNLDLPSFQRDFASLKTLDHGTGPNITFTRASGGTYFDADGVLQTAANDVPRFDHDPADGGKSLGLLIEEARTNSIRNSQAGGANVSTNAIPTHWGAATANGLTRTVVAVGTINGFSYVDLNYAGTTTAASVSSIVPESAAGQIVATNTQAWSNSCYIALVAGSTSGLSQIRLGINMTDGANSLGTLVGGDIKGNLTSSLARYATTQTTNNASTTHVRPAIELTYGNGEAIDLTLRIAAPQLEQGAFPTSYIPTTTAAATRSADSAVVTPISGFYNGTEGTIYNEFSVPVLDGASTLRGVTTFAETTGVQNRLQSSFRATGLHTFAAAAANVAEWDITSATGLITAGTTHRLAMGYNMAGNHARSHNGAAVATSSTAGTTPTRERLLLGFNGTAYIQGHIRKIAYYPRRLSNTLLEQLTT